ncbi:hypothetical protein Tsubulata_042551 [Turnera subulata]|uniref:PUM-HD domain-containing protein n=1 Tax=Turnera subulata TaxID=218843 RepID=A0A9Q0G8N6_9ROSI|nr:hypothetical protein Tsubulata_042551 [Turnera subulata]
MMFKLAKRENRVVMENMNEVPSVSCVNLNHQLQRLPLMSSSPLFSTPECSPSSSFSNGFFSSDCSLKDFCSMNGNLVDELGLCQTLSRMDIREVEQNGGVGKVNGFGMGPGGFGYGYGYGSGDVNGSVGQSVGQSVGVQCNDEIENYSCSFGGLNNQVFVNQGLQSSSRGVSFSLNRDVLCTFNGVHGGLENRGVCDHMGSLLGQNQPTTLYPGSACYNNQCDCILEQRKEQARSFRSKGIHMQDRPSRGSPCINDYLGCSHQHQIQSDGGRGLMETFSSPHLNVYDPLPKISMLKERIRAISSNGVTQSLVSLKGAGDMQEICGEESFNRRGKGLNSVRHRVPPTSNSQKESMFKESSMETLPGKSIELDSCSLHGGSCDSDHVRRDNRPFPVQCIRSMADLKGYIYLLAQDQDGCRLLQKIFDEGTSQDIQIIFDEIINHVIELMLKPFGNYVIQKLLDVCNEEQRLEIVFMATREPGQLVNICLNTYGTRVVQKLIETVRTREQIVSVILALKPGTVDLMNDQNGNHVIQRCLQCLGNEDKKFIFDAAAKFCVEIATHRHGCCVMQRCIAHSMGKPRDKMLSQVSKNGLLLAQDPFGNYVVQYIIELKIPSAIACLLSQFKGHYARLSVQKFSSHVVEKCLKNSEESRSQIVRELLSVPNFEQLLQDQYANYVIQSALSVTKGPLHATLVQAVRPHNVLRTNPHCKRIFSRNLLKK